MMSDNCSDRLSDICMSETSAGAPADMGGVSLWFSIVEDTTLYCVRLITGGRLITIARGSAADSGNGHRNLRRCT